MGKNLFKKAKSPESVGISSGAVLKFLEKVDGDQTCMHGFLILKNGQIATEGYWDPYNKDSMHRMYSVTKSFVALAIGLMCDENKISLDDYVVSYFPDKLPEDLHPYHRMTKIKDLLVMATPNDTNSYNRYDTDWAATFFNMKPSHPPGTIFNYDTAATVILNTIVERVSKMPFLEYMGDKLLDPIGFTQKAWCIKTPEGTSWGGSGALCKLRDMAKLAYVCMNKGKWGENQLISEEYIKAATSLQIDNSHLGKEGYGYQIWREEDNGFSFRGMGSQLALCYPDKDLIFACISDTQGAGPTGTGIYDVFKGEIFPSVSGTPLPEDEKTRRLLEEKIGTLKILPQRGEKRTSFTDRINHVTYELDKNPMGIEKLRFELGEDEGALYYTNETGDKCLRFGMGKKKAGSFPQTNYFGPQIGKFPGVPYRCLASGAWVEEHKLNLLVYITDDYLGTAKMSFAFKDDMISVYMTKVAEWFLDEYMGFAGGKALDIK